MAIATNFPSIKPSLLLDFANTKALDPRITFTRSTTATYYDGVTTAKAEENLLLQSQTFISGDWVKTNASVTANTGTAPDGTTTASTLTAAAGSSVKILSQGPTPIASSAYTMSFFLKAGTHNFVQLINAGDAQAFANFDVSTGTVGTAGTKTTASAVSIGSGWYRCVVTFDATSTLSAAFRLYMVASNTAAWAPTFNATGSETVQVWGAQLEQRSSVTAYTPTTTQAITNYIPALQTAAAGVARFDHNPITDESLGLLIEEQRTNLLVRSQEFNNASWVSNGGSVTANTVVAPDGTLTGSYLTRSTSIQDGCYQTLPGGTSGVVAASVFVKQVSASDSYIWIYDATAVASRLEVAITWSSGTPSVVATVGTVAAPVSVGNGWWRISATSTALTGANVNRFYLFPARAGSSNGQQTAFWGAQVEAGSFATSYIPTVAATVTRNADAASMTGTNFSSWYNAGEGTLYIEAQRTNTLSAGNFAAEIVGGSSSLRFRTGGTTVSFQSVVAGSTQADLNLGTATIGTLFKAAAAYRTNDFAGSLNAATVVTDSSGTTESAMSSLTFNNNSIVCQIVRKFAYYPIRVTNANLQALTS